MMRALGLLILSLAALQAAPAQAASADIPWTVLEARYASPASRFIDLPSGVRLHYRDEGRCDGPALILLHGFSASLQAWEPWVTRLSGEYRMITLDLPGHGLTRTPKGYRASLDANAAIVADLAERLGVGRFVMVGNSMGGAVAWNLAMLRPDLLNGLVLVDAAGWPGKGGAGGRPMLAYLIANPLGRAVAGRIDPRPIAAKGLAMAYLDPALVTAELIDRYADLARAPGHRGVLVSQRATPARRVTAQSFAALRVPTLVMAGEMDRIIPVAQSRAFAEAIPGARLVIYPDGGHVPMEQLPDQSASDLRAFIQSLKPTP
ncbi:alpha/beta hydrolase [soil metagenome]